MTTETAGTPGTPALPEDLRLEVEASAELIAHQAAAVLALIDDQDNMPHALLLRGAVAQMGWLADRLCQRVNRGYTIRGNAADWLLEQHSVRQLRTEGGAA